jgi:predicted ATPase/DNA-binding XRE family transcriptional regulator
MNGRTSSFAEILRRLRTTATLSQEELAERAGLSARGISDLERGARRAPHLETVRVLADALALAEDDRRALLAAARPPSSEGGRDVPATANTVRLPHPLTPLVGRDREAAGLRALLGREDVRMVTVTGPGGIGKTRLAIDVAAAMRREFANGVVYLDLTSQTEAAMVIPTIANAFGIYETRGSRRFQALIDTLEDKHLLLMLDNCERLLGAAADITTLLVSCPRLSVLATSHEAFRLRGERDYPLAPLPLPEMNPLPPMRDLAANASVALFALCAEASDPTFALTDENGSAVAAICHRLDGLPLAIELAAARVRMLPPEALLARLSSRLPLLIGGPRDAPARQRTLRDTIAWGYDLLLSEEQTLFRRLGVLVGGWTLDMAEVVVNFDRSLDVPEGIASLIDKGLVRLLASGSQPRYGMLETIREFALERLTSTPEEAGVREAHVRAMLALASGTWWAFPERSNVQDAREWLDLALAQPEHASPEARALALASAALSAFNQHDFPAAVQLADASLELSRSGGFDHQTGLALYVLLVVRQEQGDYAQSIGLGEEAIRHFRQSGDARWLSQALIDTGTSAFLHGEAVRAATLREEGFALCRAAGNLVSLAQAINDLGIEAAWRGEPERALAHFRESLSMIMELGERVYIAHPLASMASLLVVGGQHEVAARLLGAVAFMHETNRTFPWNTERARDEQTASQARAALGEAQFTIEFNAGRRWSVIEAARSALAAADRL